MGTVPLGTSDTRCGADRLTYVRGVCVWFVWLHRKRACQICETCTFVNAPWQLACAVCFALRVNAKDRAVLWEWQADDQYLAYDSLTCAQIEEAFKRGQSYVDLSDGFFRDNPGYRVLL